MPAKWSSVKPSASNAKLVLVTGLSGAGRSTALKTLEDCGFEAIDNLPLAFLPAVAAAGEKNRGLAVGVDARSRGFSAELFQQAIAPLQSDSRALSIMFLDCDDAVLTRRFTETRRAHPLAYDRPAADGIAQERRLLEGVRARADIIIDTSDLSVSELRRIVTGHFCAAQTMTLTVMSFSYKKGVPREADMVFDARFLRNPHYEPALSALSGRDAAVGAYIAADPAYAGFFAHLRALLMLALPRFREEGRQYVTIAIGCTGGRHRSVFIAEQLASALEAVGYAAAPHHRDVGES